MNNMSVTLCLLCIGAVLLGSAALIGKYDNLGSEPADIRLTALASTFSVIQSKLFGDDYDAPVAKSKTFTTCVNVPIHITLPATGKGKLEYHLQLDRDADGAELKVKKFHGTLVGPKPNLDYYPREDFRGLVEFVFFVTDERGRPSNRATITIVVGLPSGGPQKE